MRLDLTVNILTYSALKNKTINVYGGKQIRPNIHIDDMCSVYEFFKKINLIVGFIMLGMKIGQLLKLQTQ